MAYKKINLEFIVFAEDAEAIVAELNAGLDRMEEKHTIFGGAIEAADVEHRGTRRRSALMHTREAGELAANAMRTAGGKVAGALRQIL
jgi:hypothetical protein